MRPPERIAVLLIVATAALALQLPRAARSGDGPYILGGSDDPNKTDEDDDRGPDLVEAVFIRSHRYSEQFSVESVAVSPDGLEIAAITAVSRQGPRSWEFATGRPLELPPMPSRAGAVAYSTARDAVAVALQEDVMEGHPGGVEVYDLDSGRPGPLLSGGADAKDLAFSPDDHVLVAAVRDGVIGWDLNSGRTVDIVRVPGGADLVSFLSADSLLVGSENGRLLMRVSVDGRVEESWEGRPGSSACVSPDGRLVAIGGMQAIRVVDLWSGGRPQVIPVDEEITALDWSASGEVLAAGTSEGRVLVFGIRGSRGLSRNAGSTHLGSSSSDGGRSEARRDADSARDDRGNDSRDDRGYDSRDDRGRDRGQDDGWSTDLDRGRDEGRGGIFSGTGTVSSGRSDSSGTAVATPPEPERPELVGEVKILLLDSFGGDPRTSARLERSLRSNLKRIEPCWKREARKGDVEEGELILPMSVSAEGEGRGFGDPLTDTIRNEKLLTCIQDKLRGNVFPPGLGSLEIELTLTLRPEH